MTCPAHVSLTRRTAGRDIDTLGVVIVLPLGGAVQAQVPRPNIP
jgi:hypothetical protein